ncbi:MAG: HAD family hydrolase [Roseburia sp.]|nr:HAD family hydrolase [Roseburia sp.]
MTSYQNKKCGLLFDLHDTLVNSREAWLLGLTRLNPFRDKEELEMLYDSLKRKEICKFLDISYEDWLKHYQDNISVKPIMVELLNIVSTKFKCYIVSNASSERVHYDCRLVGEHYFQKIYCKEDGIKPNAEYLKSILADNQLDYGILVGDNYQEDYINLPTLQSVIINQSDDAAAILEKIISVAQKFL